MCLEDETLTDVTGKEEGMDDRIGKYNVLEIIKKETERCQLQKGQLVGWLPSAILIDLPWDTDNIPSDQGIAVEWWKVNTVRSSYSRTGKR